MSLPAIIQNPFRSSIVGDPWQSPETDVTSVHKDAFEKCCAALAAVRANRRTTSVLVHGEPGSGKTHLLARLRARIAQEAEADGPGGLQEAIFISVRLQTGARMIWRHLRDRFASDLLRPASDGRSQLERLLLHRLSESGLVEGDLTAWLQRRRKDLAATNAPCLELEELFDQTDAAGRIGHNLRVALGHLLLRRHRSLAAAWLRGESLPVSALQRLEITSAQDGDEELEEEARRIALALDSLATPETPIIFCFDQVEALQASSQETDGIFTFGQMISALHDETRHALLISCMQTAFLDILRGAIRGSDYDRLREFAEVILSPLTWDDASQLIKARMSLSPELARLRADRGDSLWPLREDEIKSVFVVNRCAARKVLERCAYLLDAQSVTSPLPTPLATEFLNQALEERRRKALEESDPSQTEKIIAHGLPYLLGLARQNIRQKQRDLPRDIDMLIERSDEKVAISVCNSRHWPSLVRKLERLNTQLEEKRLDNLTLLRDGRLPIGENAAKTRALREQLLKKGARWVEPSVEALVALDALRRLLADAQSGDLANHGDTLEVKTVQDWLAQHLAPELKDFLAEVFPNGASSPPDELYEEIAELLGRQHIVSAPHVAALLGRENAEVEACVQKHSERIGALGDPPAVLFRLVNEVLTA